MGRKEVRVKTEMGRKGSRYQGAECKAETAS